MINKEDLARISDARMLNFGSGPSAYAFDYEAAGVNGVNLAMTPSAFGMETALLREYARYFRKGCAAVFAVCPFSFGENESNKDPKRYTKYYGVLSRGSIDSLPFPLPHWSDAAAERIDPEHPLFPYGTGLDRDEVPSAEVMEERIEAMCRCWKSELCLIDFFDVSQAEYHRRAFARERQAMMKTLDTARASGLRPYILLPPLHSRLRRLFSKEFFDAFVTDRINDMDAPILDYTDDPMITDDMFLGPVFLNRMGARQLTEAVWSIVRE